jgi:bla regulator protein BlaR1
MIGLILDHIWQSTLFVAVASLLTFFLRANAASVRYSIWLSASLKFLFPLALLTASGTALSDFLPWQLPAIPMLDGATQPFTADAGTMVQTILAPTPSWDWEPALALVWFVGFAWIVALWLCRWVNLRAITRLAVPFAIGAPLPVKSSPSLLEPGLVGIFRPVLLLPTEIANQLSTGELDAIIAHELCHWRRRDNLTAALHMLVEALFWFHPLVWWLETQLIAERERACDEAVVATGRDPELYAESILKVCKFYVQSPLPCASGVSGGSLKRRMEDIMRKSITAALTLPKKVMLVTAGAVVLAIPVFIGLGAPDLHAQSYEKGISSEARDIANSLEHDPALFDKDKHVRLAVFFSKLDTLTRDHGLLGSYIVDGSGKVLGSTAKRSFKVPKPPSATDFAQARAGSIVVDATPGSATVTALTQMHVLNAYLLVAR